MVGHIFTKGKSTQKIHLKNLEPSSEVFSAIGQALGHGGRVFKRQRGVLLLLKVLLEQAFLDL
jgi:hypothetical protein